MTTTFNGDVVHNAVLNMANATTVHHKSGSILNAAIASGANIDRSKMALESLKAFVIPLTDFRVWDAYTTVLPAASATDDLGLYGGTFGSASPYIGTSDLKTAGATTRYARVATHLPDVYEADADVKIRLFAGMITTVADVSATIDVECYESDGDSTISADLCTTAATSINGGPAGTFANVDFVITDTGLSPNDLLDIRVTIAVNDASSGTAVIGAFGKAYLLCDARG